MTSVVEISSFANEPSSSTHQPEESMTLWNLKYQDLKILIRERPETCAEIGLIDFIEDDELVPYDSLRFNSEYLENEHFIDSEDQYPAFLNQFPNLREYRTFYSCSYESKDSIDPTLEFLLGDVRATQLYLRIEITTERDPHLEDLQYLRHKLEQALQARIAKHGAGVIFYVELINSVDDMKQICGFYSGTLICSSKVSEVKRLIELTSATHLATANPKIFRYFVGHRYGLIGVGFIEPLNQEVSVPFPRHIDLGLEEIHFYEATPQEDYGFNYAKTINEVHAFEYYHRIRVAQGPSLQIRTSTKSSGPRKQRTSIRCRKFINLRRFQLPIPITALRVFEELFPNVALFSLLETFQKRYYQNLALKCTEVEREYKRRLFG